MVYVPLKPIGVMPATITVPPTVGVNPGETKVTVAVPAALVAAVVVATPAARLMDVSGKDAVPATVCAPVVMLATDTDVVVGGGFAITR